MWTLEIENVKSDVTEFTFDTYVRADNFLYSYMSARGLFDRRIGRMYATKDHATTTGELIQESGELVFITDDTDSFHANYTITRR